VASIWRIRSTFEGTRHPRASYLSQDWEVSFTPIHVGWHLAVRVFLPMITQERRLKPHSPDLIGGGISPCLIL
jgi:hypothetical protein